LHFELRILFISISFYSHKKHAKGTQIKKKSCIILSMEFKVQVFNSTLFCNQFYSEEVTVEVFLTPLEIAISEKQVLPVLTVEE